MILDTNALSAFIDGEPAVGARLSGETYVAIPVIVLGEFRYGIAGSRHRDRYEQWLTDHLSSFEILGVTEPTTLTYARVRVSLKKRGRPIPANDAWIAALYPLPKISLIPLLIIWLGTGEAYKIVISAVTAFFPIVISTYAGIRQVDRGLMKAAMDLGASPRQIQLKVVIPAAIPSILAGLQLVASKRGAIPEMTADTDALLFDPEDDLSRILSGRIERVPASFLAAKPDRDALRSKFSAARMAREILAAYHEIL